jgi:hypothetical protein
VLPSMGVSVAGDVEAEGWGKWAHTNRPFRPRRASVQDGIEKRWGEEGDARV